MRLFIFSPLLVRAFPGGLTYRLVPCLVRLGLPTAEKYSEGPPNRGAAVDDVFRSSSDPVQISEIQTTVAAFPLLSRHELGQTICEQLAWRTGTGTNRIQLCQRLLEELERLGLLVLPAKDTSYARGPRKPIEKSQRTEKQPAIAEPLGELLPLQLRLVQDEDEVSEWNEFVDL